jgi:hypothetical protein
VVALLSLNLKTLPQPLNPLQSLSLFLRESFLLLILSLFFQSDLLLEGLDLQAQLTVHFNNSLF